MPSFNKQPFHTPHLSTEEVERRVRERAEAVIAKRFTELVPRRVRESVAKIDLPRRTPPRTQEAETHREKRDDLARAINKAEVSPPQHKAKPAEEVKQPEISKEKKEKANIAGAALTGMGAPAPEGTTDEDMRNELQDALPDVEISASEEATNEDMLNELKDALGNITPHREAARVEGWLREKDIEQVAGVFKYNKQKDEWQIIDTATGDLLLSESDEQGAHIPWRTGNLYHEGSVVALVQDDSGVWSIVQDLGNEGTYKTEADILALTELDVSRHFNEEVQNEVERDMELGADEVVRREANRLTRIKPEGKNWRERYRIGENRIDVTELETVTIDPETAMDFDDALSVRTLKNGDIEVWVHSASPLDFIGTHHRATFQEAMRRGTSVYLKGTVVPMLPPFYSGGVDVDGTHHEGVASLVEGKERVTNSIVFTFRNGQLLKDPPPFKAMTVMKSNKRFSYEEAQDVVDGKKESPHKDMLSILVNLSRELREERIRQGQISLPERAEWNIEREGGKEKLVAKERVEMMKVIEDFMVLANITQGERLVQAKKEFPESYGVFRIHEPPTLGEIRDAAVALDDTELVREIDAREKGALAQDADGVSFETRALLRFMERLKVSERTKRNLAQGVQDRIARGEIKKEDENQELLKLIRTFEQTYERQVMPIVMRLVNAAYVGSEPRGHFFIGSSTYSWWTSPMRRAADILAELFDRTYQYKKQGKNITPIPPELGRAIEPLLAHISERGVMAKAAEQQSLRMYATSRLERSVGKTIPIRIVGPKVVDRQAVGVRVRVPLKGTSYEQDYTVLFEDFDGMPETIEEIRALRGDAQVVLEGVDVRTGTVRLKYVERGYKGGGEA